MTSTSPGGRKRGFAAMHPDKQREIASKGGQSVPSRKRSFAQDPTLASEAGRKGGQSLKPEDRTFTRDRSLAAAAGRKGGKVSHGTKQALTASQDDADRAAWKAWFVRIFPDPA